MTTKKQKILVTGGLGFIGYNVVLRLMNLGHIISIVDTKTTYGDNLPKEELDSLHKERFYSIANRVTDSNHLNIYTIDVGNPDLDQLFKSEQFDAVIHLASFPRQKIVNSDPQAGSKVMSEGLLNLLELSRLHGVGRFTYISSSMVYGDFVDGVTEDAVCNPQGQYAIMKYAGELLVKDYTRQYNLKHTIIRPSAVYGPVDVDDRVISKFFLNAMQNLPIRVYGKMEKLDFTFVNDLAHGIVEATISEKAENETYNLTRSKGITLYDAARLVSHIVGKGNIDVKNRDMNYPTRGSLSIAKAYDHFRFDPATDIEEGFKIYYDWFQNNTYWQEKLNPKPVETSEPKSIFDLKGVFEEKSVKKKPLPAKSKKVIKKAPAKTKTPVSTKTVTSKTKAKPKVKAKAPTKAKAKAPTKAKAKPKVK